MNETSAADAGLDADPILKRSLEGHVLTLTLNRPQAGNSLSLDMIAALQAALDESADDAQVHVLVIEGMGDRVFCAGHDLREVLSKNSPAFSKEMASRCSRMMQSIVAHPRPVIAKVRGVATAAGLQIVASADLAYAARSARFATPGVNIGLWCLTPMVALGRAVSRKHAMQMLLSGRLFDAEHAFRIGLVNEIADDERLDEAVAAAAAEIADKSPFTVALGKQGFYRQLDMSLPDAYEYAGELVVRNMLAEDAAEGIGAFVEKRKPVWRGR
ncbi:MAG: enoyl-CoA hydratase [Burkholderiaceae bacterium]|jgi:enoyl-CoA hydratase/carnithine racemase|nr:enoyl-CoA hydratase [Burkholderiaceae bacterium]MEB2317332.1 enoyl-CoA hydratase [Pseudomonadota bacterium]